MTEGSGRRSLNEYCRRFGQIAVGKGFVTAERVKAALAEQVDDDIAGRPHRLVGAILFEKGWMTPKQIEAVLNELFRDEAPPGTTAR